MTHTHTTEADKARAIADAAAKLAERLTATGNEWTPRAQGDLLKLCNAVIAFIDDGDCIAERDILMDELGCDEHGNPLPPEPSDLVRLPTGLSLRATLNPISFPGAE